MDKREKKRELKKFLASMFFTNWYIGHYPNQANDTIQDHFLIMVGLKPKEKLTDAQRTRFKSVYLELHEEWTQK